MMRRQVLGIAFVILLLLLAWSSTVTLAQNPDGLTIGFEITTDGGWKVVELFGQKMELDPTSFNSVARVLGLQFELQPRLLPPELVATFRQADIEQLTLALEGEAANVWLNDMSSPQAKVHLQNLQGLLPEPFAQSYGFLREVLQFLRGTVYVRFTPQAFVRPELVAMAVPPAEVEVDNVVRLAVTLSPQGRWLSAGGFTIEEAALLGVALPDVDPSVAAMLAPLDKVTVDVTPSELMVSTNEQPVVELLWDADGRQRLLEIVQGLVPGLNLDHPQIAPVVELAETWLASSHVNLDLHVANKPMDSVSAIEIGRPVTVALDETGIVYVMDMPVAAVDPQVAGPVMGQAQAAGIKQAEVCWDAGQLRVLVNNTPMPYVTADPGWLTKAIQVTGWQPHSIAEKLEQILAEARVPVALMVDREAAAPVSDCGAYEAAQVAAPAMAFAVDATWNPQLGELALQDVGLPFATLGMMPIDIAAQVRLPAVVAATVPPGLGRVEASVGADGFTADLDDVSVAVHWDSRLLSNLAEVADGFGIGHVIRQVAPLLSVAEISVNVERIETIAGSPEAREISEVTPAVATLTSVTPAAERPATVAEAQVKSQEQLVTSPESAVCVMAEGDSLWTCWEQSGRTEGTGLVWVDWKNAAIKAYSFPVNEQGVVIVQPGDTIAAVPAN